MSFRLAPQVHLDVSLSPSTPQLKPNYTNDDHSIKLTIPPQVTDPTKTPHQPSEINYLSRAQWLRAAVLGANDGLVSTASIMIGVGAVNETSKAMLISGLAGLVAGALSMAIGEFVSVSAQYDIQVAQMKRENKDKEAEKDSLPNPFQAAGASALAFALGAIMPLLAGGFISPWTVRICAVCAVTSLGLAGFGAVGAVLGGAKVWKSTVRVFLGGWVAMAVSYGLLRLFGLAIGTQV